MCSENPVSEKKKFSIRHTYNKILEPIEVKILKSFKKCIQRKNNGIKFSRIYKIAGCQWFTHVILATWESEIRRIVVSGHPGQKYETASPK
jgi:hypothetical protein